MTIPTRLKNRPLLAAVLLVIVLGLAALIYLRRDSNAKGVAIPEPTRYVALGDSVAAGVGLSTASDSSACGRTEEAYPRVLAAVHNFQLTSLACSGATLPSGIQGAQEVNKLSVKPQLDQLFGLPTPKFITLTIGANDAGWASEIAQCYAEACGSESDTAQADKKTEVLSQNLEQVLAAIADHYQPAVPRIVLTGYYQLFPTSLQEDCVVAHGLSSFERSWLREQTDKLNSALQKSTQNHAFAQFSPVDFSGHELCTADPWIQDTANSDPFHPNEAGQSAIAKAIKF